MSCERKMAGIRYMVMGILMMAMRFIVNILINKTEVPEGMEASPIMAILPTVTLIASLMGCLMIIIGVVNVVRGFLDPFGDGFSISTTSTEKEEVPEELEEVEEVVEEKPEEKVAIVSEDITCPYCDTLITRRMRERYHNCPNCGAPFGGKEVTYGE